jgi:hypothetical protein
MGLRRREAGKLGVQVFTRKAVQTTKATADRFSEGECAAWESLYQLKSEPIVALRRRTYNRKTSRLLGAYRKRNRDALLQPIGWACNWI